MALLVRPLLVVTLLLLVVVVVPALSLGDNEAFCTPRFIEKPEAVVVVLGEVAALLCWARE
jgi:hypothetical protein